MVSRIQLISALPLLLILALSSGLIPSAGAIKCWECNSAVDPSCADITSDTAKNEKYVDCSTKAGFEYILCRKQVQDVDGETRIVRSCGFEKSEKSCYTTANPPVKTTVCQCFEDGCNPATRVQFSSLVTLLSVILVSSVYYIQLKSTI